MNDDLVKRLRARTFLVVKGGNTTMGPDEDCADAAAEITRLRDGAWKLAMKANGCDYFECVHREGDNCECGKLYRDTMRELSRKK